MSKAKQLINFKTIFGAVIVVLLIVVVVVLVVMNKTTYNDDYFVSDDTKLVLSMDARISGFEESEYMPPITRVVYYYSGDTISGVRVFYEYRNNEIAKKAYETIGKEDKEWAASKALNDKYIIFDMTKEQYEGLNTNQIRESIESIMGDAEFNKEESYKYGYDGEEPAEEVIEETNED